MNSILSQFDISGNLKTIVISTYALWFVASNHLKSSPPDSLPKWPVYFFYYPMKVFLSLCGVYQTTEFNYQLNPKKRYMICCLPHGAYAFSGACIVGPQMRLNLIKECENHRFFFGVASVLFYLPGVRELLLFMGCREITKGTVTKLINHTPANLAMIPGGVYEQKSTRHDEECHYVQKKLGFIKLAFELGVDILPMYGFGENQVYTVRTFGPWYIKLQHWIASNLRMGFVIVTGKFGFTLLPHATNIVHVFGKPIHIIKNQNPSDQLLNETYEKYSNEVKRIFNSNAKRLLPKEVAEKGIKVIRIGVDVDHRL